MGRLYTRHQPGKLGVMAAVAMNDGEKLFE